MTKSVSITAILLAALASPALAQNSVAMDQPLILSGVDTVCTGIGSDAQHDPRWAAYPIRVEFANGAAQYLSGAHVELSTAAGKHLASLDCDGPWVLFKLAPGRYKVSATLIGDAAAGTSSASFSPPASGQKRVELGFRLPANH